MTIEQKLQEIFVECAVRGKLYPRPDDCSSISCSECKIALILALLQPQQPAEGELVECSRIDKEGFCYTCSGDCEDNDCLFKEGRAVQLAHMKAQGWVKLPKDFGGQLDEKVFSGLHTGILEHAGSPVSIFLTSREIRAMTDEILKLLSATK